MDRPLEILVPIEDTDARKIAVVVALKRGEHEMTLLFTRQEAADLAAQLTGLVCGIVAAS